MFPTTETPTYDVEMAANYSEKLSTIIADWAGVVSPEKLQRYHYERFATFIGYPFVEGSHFVVDIEKPEVRAILDKLDSPHRHALLRAMKIQKRYKHD